MFELLCFQTRPMTPEEIAGAAASREELIP
jgi:hypothetical protein